MGAAEPPYLYDAATSQRPLSYPYASFEPKRVTQNSWDAATTASRPKSTQSGPLIDFNRHPDSYMVVTGSDIKHESLPSNTKRNVGIIRWIQFSLRVLTLLTGMGLLFCVICLQPTDQTQAWIMRIAPGYDILIGLYAVYHLIRSSKARTPASSASYHIFAFLMDGGMIPFYAFIAVFTIGNIEIVSNVPTETSYMWSSFFTSSDVTVDIIFSAFCTASALAGLHFIGLCLSLYLIIIFRKIANLPPDMNPLEDNLTSRKSSKHKYKNSELSLSSTASEKKPGFYSGSTMSGSAINVNASRSSIVKAPEVRQIAFGHSRANSDLSFSPHNPTSAHISKQQYGHSIYAQTYSARNSAVSIGQPQSFTTADSRAASPNKDSMQQRQKQLMSDNWYVLDEEPADISMSTHREPRLPNVHINEETSGFIHQPLAMNPPSPAPPEKQRDTLGEVSINRSLTVTSDKTVTSSVYSESAPSLTQSKKSSTPKSKYYGDLAAAARGVRGYSVLPQTENELGSHSAGKSQGRVVSRSGADIADENMRFIPEKNSRRRMVSGKAAEEGLAMGYWY